MFDLDNFVDNLQDDDLLEDIREDAEVVILTDDELLGE